MRPSRGFLLLICLSLATIACSVDDATACRGGETRACACTSSEAQVCADDGSRWLPCACADAGPEAAAGAGGSSGSPPDASPDGMDAVPDVADEPVEDSPSADAPDDTDSGDVQLDAPVDDAEPDAEAGCTGCTALEVCGANGLCVAAQKELGPGRWIDVTEVTRAQYAAWMATQPSTSGQPSFCQFNTGYGPGCTLPMDSSDAFKPMVCIDWCDARAYCLAVGKRLCGHPSGGATPYDHHAEPAQSVWFEACSSWDAHAYPYGDAYLPGACNGNGSGIGTTSDVAEMDQCQSSVSAYAGIFDLSGNAVEFEDSCATVVSGPTDRCRVRGGSFFSPEGDLRCDFKFAIDRSYTSDRLGFRCCKGP